MLVIGSMPTAFDNFSISKSFEPNLEYLATFFSISSLKLCTPILSLSISPEKHFRLLVWIFF